MRCSLYTIPLEDIEGTPCTLEPYGGRVLFIVNVASMCGLTPQYEGLHALAARYRTQGLEGFPANDFMGQEPGTNAEIRVDREGGLIARFGSRAGPLDETLITAVEKALAG